MTFDPTILLASLATALAAAIGVLVYRHRTRPVDISDTLLSRAATSQAASIILAESLYHAVVAAIDQVADEVAAGELYEQAEELWHRALASSAGLEAFGPAAIALLYAAQDYAAAQEVSA